MNLICLCVGHDWRYMRCNRCNAWRPEVPLKLVPSLAPPTVHQLKCWPEQLKAINDGSKPYEVRKLDRDYQVGHVLLLTEWHPIEQAYGPLRVSVIITHILQGGQFGIEPGYGVLGIKKVR